MRPPSKPRPFVASLIAAAVAVVPLVAFAMLENAAARSCVVAPSLPENEGFCGGLIALAASPFLYLIAVPLCYLSGQLLLSSRLQRLSRFLAGAAVLAVLLGVLTGWLISAPSRFGLRDLVVPLSEMTLLFLISVLPAALCWWFVAIRPHNPPLQRDAPRAARP